MSDVAFIVAGLHSRLGLVVLLLCGTTSLYNQERVNVGNYME